MRYEWRDSAPHNEGRIFAVEGGAGGFNGNYMQPDRDWPWYRSTDPEYRVDHGSVYGREILRLAAEVETLRGDLAVAEAVIADWLEGQADGEQVKIAAGLSVRAGSFHFARAGALREAAEAVRQGRARREGGA